MPPWLEQVLSDVAGGVIGGLVGFGFAYRLARIQRDWDRRDQGAALRREQIARAKAPLVRIRDEIESNYSRQAYFNRVTEDKIQDQIWAASYALGDAELVRLLEEARRPLHEYAWATNEPGKIDALKPYLNKLISRLEALGDNARAMPKEKGAVETPRPA